MIMNVKKQGAEKGGWNGLGLKKSEEKEERENGQTEEKERE